MHVRQQILDEGALTLVTLALGLAAILLTAGLMAALRPLSYKLGLIDRPGGRKAHATPTPATGGLAIAVGVGIPCLLLFYSEPTTVALLLAGLIVVISGFLDDLVDLNWIVRVLIQAFAAVVLITVGDTRVEQLGDIFGDTALILSPTISYMLTIFATVGIINAINMIDGVDGLAGSVVLVALSAAGTGAFYAQNENLASGILIISGGIVGFLFFNIRTPWHRSARAFLGNSGSGLLGLIVAWVCFRLTQDPLHPISPVLAPYFVAIPVIDCLSLIVRRVLRGQSPFAADRTHLHHVMLDAGMNASMVVLLMVVGSASFALLAVFAVWIGVPHEVLPALFVVLVGLHAYFGRDHERSVRAVSALKVGLNRLSFGR